MTLTKQQIEKAISLFDYYRAAHDRIFPPSDLGTIWPGDPAERMSGINQLYDSDECKKLSEFLRSLKDDELREFQAVMFIGRGDYDAKDLEQAIAETDIATDRQQEIDYILEKSDFGGYLADGFEQLNRARMI
jgi:Protein of unknown function (DUF3775)